MLLSLLRGVGEMSEASPPSGQRTGLQAKDPPDEALVRRALAGDDRALGELYRRHVRYVLGLAVRLLGHRSDGEDVTQDVFAITFERLSTLHDPAAFRAWAAQIAVNLVRKRIRRKKLGRLLGVEESDPDASLEILACSSGHAEARAELSLLDHALSKMPVELRLAWMLRYVEGEELEAVARLCRCSLATAKRRIARAAARVSEHLGIGESDEVVP